MVGDSNLPRLPRSGGADLIRPLRRPNLYAGWLDYARFFAAAALGGLVLIDYLRASRTPAERWIARGGYLLAMPFAIIPMLVGGLLGPLGVVLFSRVIWVVSIAIGYFIGHYLSGNGELSA